MTAYVLVAEDEPINQRMAAAVIKSCGYEAKIVSDGRECLAELQNGKHPDLLLLDLDMPVMDGFQVLRHLKQVGNLEVFPIMVFTAHHKEEIVMEAIRLGADDFIVKPFQAHELGRRIRDLVLDIDESELRRVLENLRFPDATLASQPQIPADVAQGFHLFPVSLANRSLCIAVPQGLSPQALSKLAYPEIVLNTMIFRKGAVGWRKVWPRAKNLEVFKAPHVRKSR